MIDYSELEKRFKIFRKKLIIYRGIWKKVRIGIGGKELREKEENLCSELTQTYGELAGYIHGMAGYVKKIYAGVQTDIFMLALNPNIHILEKDWGIVSSIQCLDKAIGGCRYARTVEKKADQIIIHKGGSVEGWLIIIRIFKEARKKIYVRDRYIDEEIFSIIEALNPNIDIKILIKKEPYREKKTLVSTYRKYQQSKRNVEIRELAQKEFHSREIIIDDQKGHELTFSIKDVGVSEGSIHRIKRTNLSNAISKFKSDCNLASKI